LVEECKRRLSGPNAYLASLRRLPGDLHRGVVPTLLRILHDDQDHHQRAEAARLLGDIHEPAETVVPALIGALSDPRVRVRAAAAEALGKFGPVAIAALDPLTSACNDPYLSVRFPATASRQKIQTHVKSP
jgi:HEAT repeat protein